MRVGSVDFNYDGRYDILVGTGPGGGNSVKVFDAATATTLDSFYALAPYTQQSSVFVGGN